METTDKTYHDYYGDLEVRLSIGYPVEGRYSRDLLLLPADTVSEEVFTKKLSGKPYTWIGNLIAVSAASIGGVIVPETRTSYLKNKTVVIPQIIRDMPLADANSMLVEIHRRLWQNLMPKQTIMCKFCSESLIADIDLNRIELSTEAKELISDDKEFLGLQCDLPVPFSLQPFAEKIKTIVDGFPETLTAKYNRILFKIPTLGIAINNERLANDPLKLWKKIALDCLEAIQEVDADGKVISEFPREQMHVIPEVTFYNCLGVGKNSAAVRYTLQEELPSMPFDYTEECGCPRARQIPFAMEASSFFST